MSQKLPLHAKVLTVSDSIAAGSREDLSGSALIARLTDGEFAVIEHRVVPDDVGEISNALSYMAYGFNGLILTTGGSGFGPRDFTPEATLRILDRSAPGMAEAMRSVSPRGRMSRAQAGTRGPALILNLGSAPERALEMLAAVIDVIPEALELLGGGSAPTVDAVELTSAD
ncbi:MAG: MogA/MoaB family molybdenum cofactor biosynthesis protein [Microthrixaceae bacterium]